MTKIHVKRSVTYTIEDADGKEYEVEHEPFEYFDPIIKKLASGKVVVGYLSNDSYPPNPRENDNLGVIICWHRRYNLGDKHNYADPDDLWKDLIGDEEYDKIDQAVEKMFEAWEDANPKHRYDKEFEAELNRLQWKREAIREKVQALGYFVLPIFLFDHSGISVSTGSFSCPWDVDRSASSTPAPKRSRKSAALLTKSKKAWTAKLKSTIAICVVKRTGFA